MELNRYDVPIQQATGQDYFKLPINEMMGVLANKQKAQDEAKEDIFKQQAILNSLQDGFHTKGLSDELRQKYTPILSNLYNTDLNSREGRNAMYSVKSQLQSDDQVQLSIKDAADKKMYLEMYGKNPDWVAGAIDYGKDPTTGEYIQYRDPTDPTKWGSASSYPGYTERMVGAQDYLGKIDVAGKNLKSNLESKYGPNFKVQTDSDGYLWAVTIDGKKEKIDETLPQFKAALRGLTEDYYQGKSLEGKYLRKYHDYQGLPFDESEVNRIVKDRLLTHTFLKDQDEVKANLVNPTEGNKGKGTTPEDYRVQPTVTFSGASPDYKGSDDFHSYLTAAPTNIDASIMNKAKELNVPIVGGKPIMDDVTGHKIIPIPENATPIVRDQLEKFNAQIAADQDRYDAYKASNDELMINAGLTIDPTKTPEENIIANVKDPKLLEKIKKAREFDAKVFGVDGNKLPDEGWLEVLKDDPKVRKYYDALNNFTKGVQYAGESAIPLVKGELATSAKAAVGQLLNVSPNWGTASGIELADKAGSNITIEKARELYKKNLEDNKGKFEGDVFITYNTADNEPELYINVPNPNGNPVGLKIRQGAMKGTNLGGIMNALTPEYYTVTQQQTIKNFYNGFKETNGLQSTLVPNLPSATGINTVYKSKIRTVPESHDYYDKDGNVTSIKEGDKIFTIPELPGVALSPTTDMKLFDFWNQYNIAKNEGRLNDQTAINLANSTGVNLITSPAIWKQYNSTQYAVPKQ